MKPFSKKSEFSRARPLLGTLVEIKVGGLAPASAHAAIDRAFGAIEKVHRLMSFHDPQSEISVLNSSAYHRPIQVSALTYHVLRQAKKMFECSEGSFDITIAPVLEQSGFLPTHTAPVHDPEVHIDSRLIRLQSHRRVRFLHPDLRIDLGGIAKGFAVDQAVRLLQRQGVAYGLVNAGGDLRAFGKHTWNLKIRHPADPWRSFLILTLKEGALANSGTYWNSIKCGRTMVTPFINPHSGRCVKSYSAVGVWARNCLEADALTKVVMLRGKKVKPLFRKFKANAYAFPIPSHSKNQDLEIF